MINEAKIPVMEIFGPTIQGEGAVIGRKTMFIRTGGCDYRCAWCDSAFTWNGEEKASMMTVDEIFQVMLDLAAEATKEKAWDHKRNFDYVTISGGNPALIGDPMASLIRRCQYNGVKVGVETQGSRWQDWMLSVDDLTLSPKPPSSRMATDFNILWEIVDRSCGNVNVSLKVVVFDDHDYAYARHIHAMFPRVPFFLSVGNSDPKEPGDISVRLLKKLEWLWEKVLGDPSMNDVRVLPQLHTLVWSNRRGV